MNRTFRSLGWTAPLIGAACVGCENTGSTTDGPSFGTVSQGVQAPAVEKNAKKSGLPKIGYRVTIADTHGSTQFRNKGSAVLLTNEWVLTAAHVVSTGPQF